MSPDQGEVIHASPAASPTDWVAYSPEWVRYALVSAVPLIAWVGLILKLRTDWSTNAQYEFGYFVPFFIIYLLVRRWHSRPDESSGPASLAAPSGIILLLLLLPIQIIQQANPDWRPFNWVHASVVVALSLVPFAAIGGWPWVRHFSVPFLLIFAALPWSLAIEQLVLQGLSSAVTSVTVEMLNLINVPAIQRGNVIDLATGSVGVADACSGIRSLAGTLMASLFFGEFFRLGYEKRIALVIGASLLAFVLNLFRAFFLSWRAAVEGIHSIEKWHDPAGFTIFLISFAGLWLLANLMARTVKFDEPAEADHFRLPQFQYKWIVCSIVWALGIGVVTEAWYRYREGERPASLAWSLNWPQESKAFQFTPIPEETRSILRYTSGKSAAFRWEEGSAWQVFFFHWAPGRSSVQLATMHRPEVCLPAVGYKFIGETPPIDADFGKIALPFTGSVFDSQGDLVYVYRCLWEDFPIEGLTRNRNFDMSIRGRLLGAWYGRRNLGQRLLQVAIMGVDNEESARQQLQSRLQKMIQLKG